MEPFHAVILRDVEGRTEGGIESMDIDALPEGNVLIRVAYSSLNYKDGLALEGKARVVRTYPMVPGIDLAGTVEQAEGGQVRPGDRVIVTGWGMGETRWGGYTQRERVLDSMTVPTPDAFTDRQVMALGTAGLTAMLAVLALQENGVSPAAGPVIVSGASGGVGSLSVALLGGLGYEVVASTGRGEEGDYLRRLGAAEIIGRDALGPSNRPLESGRWAGAVDTVGGVTLAGILRQMKPGGAVAACGNAGGNDLQTTVLPFILRGVSLLGIDSNYCPRERRLVAWDRLAHDLHPNILEEVTRVVPLRHVQALAPEILAGRIRGRVVVDVNGE